MSIRNEAMGYRFDGSDQHVANNVAGKVRQGEQTATSVTCPWGCGKIFFVA